MYHVHSVEALKAHLTDTISDKWHNLHQEMKDVYSRGFSQLREAVRGGVTYTQSHRLTYYASNFASTTPANREVVPGFYDTPAAEINAVFVSSAACFDVFLLNDIIQVTIDAPHQSSGSNTAGRGETSVQRARVRRNSSTLSLSTNVGASTSRKRGHSPLQEEMEDANANKRPRLSKSAREQTTHEERREGTRASVSRGLCLRTMSEPVLLSRGVGSCWPMLRLRNWLTTILRLVPALWSGSIKSLVESYTRYRLITLRWIIAHDFYRLTDCRVLLTVP